MAKLLPILLAVVGLLGGGAAGYFLRPAPEPEAHAAHPDCAVDPMALSHEDLVLVEEAGEGVESEFIEFDNQFIVPVATDDAIGSLVVLSLTLEVGAESHEVIYRRMPKLRDGFLNVLFDHSSAGGFSADFVNGRGLDTLRDLLRETAMGIAGPQVLDVLIVDLLKKDV